MVQRVMLFADVSKTELEWVGALHPKPFHGIGEQRPVGIKCLPKSRKYGEYVHALDREVKDYERE